MWNTVFAFQVYQPCVLRFTKLVHHWTFQVNQAWSTVGTTGWVHLECLSQFTMRTLVRFIQGVPCGEPGGFSPGSISSVPGPVHRRYTSSVLLECPRLVHLRYTVGSFGVFQGFPSQYTPGTPQHNFNSRHQQHCDDDTNADVNIAVLSTSRVEIVLRCSGGYWEGTSHFYNCRISISFTYGVVLVSLY